MIAERSFPVVVLASMALHGALLLAVASTEPPTLMLRTGEMSVRLRAEPVIAPAPAKPKPPEAARPVEKAAPVPRPKPVPVRAEPKPREAAPTERVVSSPTASIDHRASVDLLPRPWARNVPPKYPEAARARGDTGTVRLRLRVSADGRVGSVATLASSGFPLLDASAREAAAAWRFEPARRGGVAVAYDVIVPIDFQLERRSWARR